LTDNHKSTLASIFFAPLPFSIPSLTKDKNE